MNLVTNALEAVGDSGRVSIVARAKMVDKNSEDFEYAEILITDDGYGIEGEDLEHIFEPFYSKKSIGFSGTGLGLSIVKNIIDDHDGSVEVFSDNSGTTFSIQLPVCEPDVGPQNDEIDIALFKGVGTVLIVDDDEKQRKFSGEMLEFLGYTTIIASSGEGAVAFFQSGCADVVLLDIKMDPGIDGIETYKRITERYPMQKAIMVSGYVTDEIRQKAGELGVSAILKKPYTIRQIAQALQDTLEENLAN
jgi:CheY-like chemotaxis protein